LGGDCADIITGNWVIRRRGGTSCMLQNGNLTRLALSAANWSKGRRAIPAR